MFRILLGFFITILIPFVVYAEEQTLVENKQQEHVAKLYEKVQGNWIGLPGVDTKDLKVVIRAELEPDGNLASYPKVIKSSGNEAFDDSLIRAIRKAQPLPIPADDPAFRHIDFVFGRE